MEIYIPEEIWRHILSYLAIPYTSRCCKFLHRLELKLCDERYESYVSMYDSVESAIRDNQWGMARLLLHREYNIGGFFYVSNQIGRHGNVQVIADFISFGVFCYDYIACGAAYSGHRGIVEWMIEKGAINYDNIAYMAGQGGHRDIVERMMEKGIKQYNYLGHGAAKGGHKDIVEWLMEKGAKQYNYMACGARTGGHSELESWILDHITREE